MNTAVDPLARTTLITFPGRSVLMEKNTEVPVNESAWPRMTDEPRWPGVTLRSYQPARSWLPSGGTAGR